jgi:hypothetical protein
MRQKQPSKSVHQSLSEPTEELRASCPSDIANEKSCLTQWAFYRLSEVYPVWLQTKLSSSQKWLGFSLCLGDFFESLKKKNVRLFSSRTFLISHEKDGQSKSQ